MNKNKSIEVVLVVDRSGSMMSMAKDMEGGMNSFISDQKNNPGKCNVTYYRFDTVIEKVLENQDVKSVGELKIEPRGGTALFDAIGTAIQEVGQRLSKLNKSQRPDIVSLLIVTDGEENSSKEYTQAKVKEMIKHQEDVYKWEFVFLGANQDAFSNGQSFGFAGNKSMTYDNGGVGNVMKNLSAQTSSLRDGTLTAGYSFSAADRASAVTK